MLVRIALTLTAPKAKDNCDKDITGIPPICHPLLALATPPITWKFVDAATKGTAANASAK